MQLPRLIIAAVFIVIGALFAVPALLDRWGPDSAASTSATTSPGPSGDDATPSPGQSTPAERPSPAPSGATTPPRTTAPAQPVTATIGKVSCPERTVNVRIRNTGTKTEDFSIERNDGGEATPGQIPPGTTRTVAVKLREDRRTTLTVTWANKRVESERVRANCEKAGAAPTETPPSRLPHTGPDTLLWARGATGVAIIITGVIIFWYGGIWPRRREQIFADRKN